jgi:hypothetical protein
MNNLVPVGQHAVSLSFPDVKLSLLFLFYPLIIIIYFTKVKSSLVLTFLLSEEISFMVDFRGCWGWSSVNVLGDFFRNWAQRPFKFGPRTLIPDDSSLPPAPLNVALMEHFNRDFASDRLFVAHHAIFLRDSSL